MARTVKTEEWGRKTSSNRLPNAIKLSIAAVLIRYETLRDLGHRKGKKTKEGILQGLEF